MKMFSHHAKAGTKGGVGDWIWPTHTSLMPFGTPRGIGKVGKGALAGLHPQHLAATVLKALLDA